jgi:hypothetical protein
MQSHREPSRRRAAVRRTKRNALIRVESLEWRALLSGLMTGGYPNGGGPPGPGYPPPVTMPTPLPTQPSPTPLPPAPSPGQPVGSAPQYPTPPTPGAGKAPTGEKLRAHKATGIVTKHPRFYEFYTGLKWAELNAVRASAKLSSQGIFTFTGTNQGKINKGPAVYGWGIDRNGNLPAGPFTNRPSIKFDALVVVSVDPSLSASAQVIDLASGNTTELSAGSVSIHGKTVSVTVPLSLLPSTGLAPSQYRFNFWPEYGGSVASFVPESTTVQVGMMK